MYEFEEARTLAEAIRGIEATSTQKPYADVIFKMELVEAAVAEFNKVADTRDQIRVKIITVRDGRRMHGSIQCLVDYKMLGRAMSERRKDNPRRNLGMLPWAPG